METTHEVIKHKLIVFKRANSDKWQCRYRIKDEWIRCSTNEYTLDSAIQSANMILIEAHVRDKLNIAPVSKKFKDVAKLAMQRIENEIAQNEGKAIYKDYVLVNAGFFALNYFFVRYGDFLPRCLICKLNQKR